MYPAFFYLAVNKLKRDKTQNIFLYCGIFPFHELFLNNQDQINLIKSYFFQSHAQENIME